MLLVSSSFKLDLSPATCPDAREPTPSWPPRPSAARRATYSTEPKLEPEQVGGGQFHVEFDGFSLSPSVREHSTNTICIQRSAVGICVRHPFASQRWHNTPPTKPQRERYAITFELGGSQGPTSRPPVGE